MLALHALSHRPLQSRTWYPGTAGMRASRAWQAGQPRRRRGLASPVLDARLQAVAGARSAAAHLGG